MSSPLAGPGSSAKNSCSTTEYAKYAENKVPSVFSGYSVVLYLLSIGMRFEVLRFF